MTSSKIIIALGIVVAAVLLETTVFQQIQPFGYAPALGLLTVISVARYLDPEPAFVASTIGIFFVSFLNVSRV